jgi:hypothetical protein
MLCLEILRQLKDTSAKGEFNVVNLGSEVSISIAELADLISLFSPDKRVSVRVLGAVNQSAGNRVRANYVPDMSFSKELGIYRNRVAINEGIASLFS